MNTRLHLRWSVVTLVLAVMGFAIGRFNPRLEVREVVKVVEKKVEVRVAAAAEVKRVVVYRERLIQPDGTRVEREVERAETTREEATRTTLHAKTEEARTMATIAQPDWRAGGLVGGALELGPFQVEPMFGVLVERRIAGPFSVGFWGLRRRIDSYAAGLAVTIEF